MLYESTFFRERHSAHRVGFMPSVFLLALVIVGMLCAAVVLYHYLKTARMNPAETLKNE